MRKQILAAGICLCLALAPAVSTASPNAGEPLAEEAAPAGEMAVEEAAPTNEPVAAQADPQSLDEEAPSEAAGPATPDDPDGRVVERAEVSKTKDAGEQPLAGPDDVLAPQSGYTYSLYDGSYTSWDKLYSSGDSIEYTFTLYHRSRVDIVYDTEPSAGGGTYYYQMYDDRGDGSWDLDEFQYGNGYKDWTRSINYRDMSGPRSIGPGNYRVVIWYNNPYYGGYCWNRVKLDIKPLFVDLPKDHWAANVVADAVDRGFMSGYEPTYRNGEEIVSFGTNYNISRAQVASVLWNLQGQPWPGTTYSFRDVPTDKYYSTAVAWARSAGVVSGYPDGSFRPGQNVAREELAVMLHNYAVRFRGASNSGAGSASYSGMGDKYSVSPYARNAVGWCFSRGIMSGSGGLIRPGAPASRAEAAKMFLLTGNLLGI